MIELFVYPDVLSALDGVSPERLTAELDDIWEEVSASLNKSDYLPTIELANAKDLDGNVYTDIQIRVQALYTKGSDRYIHGGGFYLNWTKWTETLVTLLT